MEELLELGAHAVKSAGSVVLGLVDVFGQGPAGESVGGGEEKEEEGESSPSGV